MLDSNSRILVQINEIVVENVSQFFVVFLPTFDEHGQESLSDSLEVWLANSIKILYVDIFFQFCGSNYVL